MSTTVRWGILGTGDIARQMAEDLRLLPNAELRAVASRTAAQAEAFGETHQIPLRYGSYDALIADRNIDVIYIATPHSRHCADTLACIAGGKAVLCEKPLAMNAREARLMAEAARDAKTFLMEAMWTEFFPAMKGVRQAIAEDAIGTPKLVKADFSYRATLGPESRLFAPELGGGALLDIGIYPVALADMVFHALPEAIHTTWTQGPTGVDVASVTILEYPCGGRAVLSNSLEFNAPQEATIVGKSGFIRIPERFSQPDSFEIHRGGESVTESYERKGYGYHLEAREVVACLLGGRTESGVVPLESTIRVLEILDRIREAWGLKYDADII